MSNDGQILTRLVNLEQAIHRRGWDEPPNVYLMYRQGLSRPLGPVPNPPARALAQVARAVAAEADVPQLRAMMAESINRGLVAVAFTCETWMSTAFTSDEERQADGRDLADIPGSTEARMVCAVDLDDRQYVVMRVRGGKPKTEVYPADHTGRVQGLVFESLSMMVTAFAAVRSGGDAA